MNDASLPAERACLNCTARTLGAYCHACGQRADAERLTLKNLWWQYPHAIPQTGRGLLPTLRGLMRRPGRTINAYLDGHRVRYVNAFALVSLLAGISAFAFATWPFDFVAAVGEMPPEQAARYAEFSRLNFQFYSASLLLYLPLTALLTRVCFAGRGRGYAEHLVLNAYVLSGTTLLMLLLFPVYALANRTPWFTTVWNAGLVPMMAYQGAALYAVFAGSGRRWATALRTVLALLLYLLMLITVSYTVFTRVYLRLT